MHDEPYLESQLKAQVGVGIKIVKHLSLGPTLDEIRIDAEAVRKAPKLLDDSH